MRHQDLIKAISDRNLDRVCQYLCIYENANGFLHKKMSPLVFALYSCVYSWESGTFDAIILRLVDAGSDVNARHPQSGMTATMLAMKCRRKEQIIIRFINAEPNVNLRCRNGKSLLIHAIENGYGKTIVRELLNIGAKADYPSSGYTPLYCAVSIHNYLDIIEMLINDGANINAGDKNGKPLLAFCCNYTCRLDDICRHKRITDFLIKKGAGLKGNFGRGNTIIHLSTCNYVIWLALKKRVPIQERNSNGMTPLLRSLIYNEAEKVNDLLLMGADPNCLDTYGLTSLYYLGVLRHERFVNLLIFHGANLCAKTNSYVSPVDFIFNNPLIFKDANLEAGIKTIMKHFLLYVNENGLYEPIRRINSINNWREYFLHYFHTCKNELCTMQNTFLTDDLSFYDFCRKRMFYRTKFIRIEMDEYKCDYETISTDFPIFKDIILLRLKDNSRKKFKCDLIKQFEKLSISSAVCSGTNCSAELVYDCWYRIGKYLNFRSLYALFLASFGSS